MPRRSRFDCQYKAQYLPLSRRRPRLLAIIDFPPDGQESADPTKRNDGDQHGVTAATVIRELRQAGLELVAEEQRTRTTGYLVVVRRPAARP